MALNKQAATGENLPFIGIVEDVLDPMMLGRVKVRIVNQNDNDEPTPTEDLQWCICMMPVTSASLGGVGTSPTWLEVGSYVLGIYLDGRSRRQPMILGTYNKIPGNDINRHDVSPIARGEDGVSKEILGPEPESPYAAEYPHNKVVRTPAGHVIEIDDTPGAERIHVFHKSGSYIEIDHDGRTVRKSVGDDYQIIAGNNEVHIEGGVNVYIKGNAVLNIDGSFKGTVGGSFELESGGNMSFKAPKIDLN